MSGSWVRAGLASARSDQRGLPLHRSRVVTVVLGLLVASLAALPASGAPGDAPTFTTAEVAAGADYASDRFADPWDYANAEDQLLDPGPIAPPEQVVTMSDGVLAWSGPVAISLLFEGFGGIRTLRHGYDHPVDANAYTHAAINVWSDAVPAALSFNWRNCQTRKPNVCDGAKSFNVSNTPTGGTAAADFETLVVDLTAEDSGSWSGSVPILDLTSGDASFRVDWLRLFTPDASRDVDISWESPSPGSAATIIWDLDANPANNTSTSGGWGVLGTSSAASGTVTFPGAAFPPGEYRFYVEAGGDRSAISDVLTVDSPPMTWIDDPDVVGGEDYARRHTGDPWDFSQPTDVRFLTNVKDVVWDGSQLAATNVPTNTGGGTIGNPFFHLRMGPPIDTERYHRLTVRTDYDGDFSLSFSEGGGMHGRFLWWHGAAFAQRHVSQEIVLYSDRDTYTIDLLALGTDIEENDASYDAKDHGWHLAGSPVTDLRWDPNEDPSASRRWRVDDISLRADDEAIGMFDITWHDDAHEPGTTVSLYRDTDAAGFDGTLIAADIPQVAGTNTYRWITRDVPAGEWWIYAVATDGTSTTKRYATGPLDTDGRPRAAGPNRLLTAIALSNAAFPTGADAAVVARDRDFPDALAAAPLATAAGGPLLLNPQDHLDEDVADELERLGVSTVYLMGGAAAQGADVRSAIEALGITVIRLGGTSRYGTAALAAGKAVELWQADGDPDAGDHVLLALGSNFPDALAAGPLASIAHRPILLSFRDTVPDETFDALQAFGTTTVTLVGGTAALADSVADQLRLAGYTVPPRLSGQTRYETMEEVVRAAIDAGADPSAFVLASGANFPDALAAGPATVAAGDGILVLTDPGALSAAAQRLLTEGSPRSRLWAAGGSVALSDAVVDAALSASS